MMKNKNKINDYGTIYKKKIKKINTGTTNESTARLIPKTSITQLSPESTGLIKIAAANITVPTSPLRLDTKTTKTTTTGPEITSVSNSPLPLGS